MAHLTRTQRPSRCPGHTSRSRIGVISCNSRHQQASAAATSSSTSSASPFAAAALAVALLSAGQPAIAADASPAVASTSGSSGLTTVYYGNGCFWGRQKDFVDTEMKQLGRTSPAEISALVGYAGGRATGPGGKVCYYYGGDPRAIYERLGHAEVVQVALSDEATQQEQEFRAFASTYFKEFQTAPRGRGMMRLDPQDAGPGYRNVVGLPGGVNSPLFKLLQEANVNGMELRPGQGNIYQNGRPSEGDELNVVWVVDSNELPFYRAEAYHQLHNGLGKVFPASYTRDLKNALAQEGKIGPTGCLEVPF